MIKDNLIYQSTILSPNYKERAIKLEEFKYMFIRKLKIFREKYNV